MANFLTTMLGGFRQRLIDWADPVDPAGAANAYSPHVGATLVGTTGTPYDAADPLPIGVVAGEEHIGAVASSDIVVSVTPTLAVALHAADDCLGGKLTLADALRVAGGTAYLVSVTVSFKIDVTPNLEIVLFNADPTSSTLTDDSALSVHADDAAKMKAVARVYSSDYVQGGTPQVASVDVGPILVTGAATELYAAIKNVDAVTPTGASDMTVDFGFMRN